MPSAVEPSYLRFVATFGSESRYCKTLVDSPAVSWGWHTGPGYAGARGGPDLLCHPLQAWDTLLCWPHWCDPSLGARSSLHKHRHCSAVPTRVRDSVLVPCSAGLCFIAAFSSSAMPLSCIELLLRGRD